MPSVSIATAVNAKLPPPAGVQERLGVKDTLAGGAVTLPIDTLLAKNSTLAMNVPGVDAPAVALIVCVVLTGSRTPSTGLVTPTEGAAFTVTVMMLEMPWLPKVSVTKALRL